MSVEIRLLYVDDNPLDRELVRDALAHDTVSFQVTEAASRAEFEACLGPGRYDLVLSDFNILGFQGLQVLAAVKAVDPGVPVVIVTGTGSEEVAVEAMKRGAADYVIKDPRRIQRLPRTLRAILEQARQRQAAAEATARYRELFRSVPVALYRFTLDGDVFFANPAFLALLGLAESERFRHLPLTDLFVSAAALTDWLQRLDREGLVRGFEAQWRRQDGSVIWTRAHARAVRDEHFQVLYCEGSLEDITERKQAEAALRYHASLMEQVSDAVMSTDAEFRVVSWNPAAEAIYGYTAAEMLGRPVGVLVDPAFPAEEREQLRAEFVRQGYWHSEIRHRHKDGRPLIIHSAVTALRGPDGQFQGAVGVNRDITAARQADVERQAQAARYQLALEGADLGTWDWNVATGEVAFNARWCAMLGYAPEEVAPDVSVWRHLLHPADQPAVEAVLQAHLAGQTPAYETEHRLRHKAGAWVWVLDRGRVIERDAAGRPLRMCGTHLDITERKQAEAGLRASAAQYQAILETAQDGFWLVDGQGRFLDVNDAYCRLI
ncbi:MAG: PAS domain S-box protein, partial [Anaerolineales bacterium]|nr:PAS domain S-box protein [Anaerolineales bacterium]